MWRAVEQSVWLKCQLINFVLAGLFRWVEDVNAATFAKDPYGGGGGSWHDLNTPLLNRIFHQFSKVDFRRLGQVSKGRDGGAAFATLNLTDHRP